MNADSPTPNAATPNAEEGAVSAPLEKLPKLNLPPKPVLATAATATPPSPPPTAAPAIKPTSEPPPIVATPVAPSPAPAQVVATPAKKSEAPETPTANIKRATLSMPLAMITFAVALLGLIVQLVAFLHLF